VGRFGRRPLRPCFARRPSGARGEEVVVRRRSNESVELHCHGGHAAAAMIRKSLVGQGGRTIAWQEWVAGHHPDPIAVAAHLALAEARTERTAAILLDQYHGALRRALEEIEEALRNGDTLSACTQIEALLAYADLGRHLTRPWQVVLTGRPNVGKSSLINALVGYPRAIVHHTPGTTRDVLSATTTVDGWPIELSDTAGLSLPDGLKEKPATEPVEGATSDRAAVCEGDAALRQAGTERARDKLACADLVVLVFDASPRWSAADRALIEAWPDGLIVHNKSDLSPAPGRRPSGFSTSALTGDGVEALGQAIADHVVRHPPPPGTAVPFTPEQREHLARCWVRAGGEGTSSGRLAGDGR
jgi:tRNA modification GTPase